MKEQLLNHRLPKDKEEISTERSGFFMDIVKFTVTVGRSSRDGEDVSSLQALDLCNNEGQVGKFDDCDLELMHHNVQSLNN
jgi:hypothetical protein